MAVYTEYEFHMNYALEISIALATTAYMPIHSFI